MRPKTVRKRRYAITVSTLLFICAGLFVAFLISSEGIYYASLRDAAAVGAHAGVPETAENRLVAQLQGKEQELDKRAEQLALRELAILKKETESRQYYNVLLFSLLLVGLTLTALISLNFYYDLQRSSLLLQARRRRR